jgi:hypothetical protein
MAAVGHHVPEESVDKAEAGVEPLVLGDEQANPLVGQVEPGISAKVRSHPSWLSLVARFSC